MHTTTLNGCAPFPLAHYLKALGILRLVSEQADPAASGFWRGEQFILNSDLDNDSLADFLLRQYRPTAVLNPWNGDGGFFKDSRPGAVEVLEAIRQSTSDRFLPYRATIRAIRSVFDDYGIVEKPADEQKSWVLLALRSALPEEAIGWIDAVTVLTDSGVKYPPLLGSGGNDGSMDFSKNFMQRLAMILDLTNGAPTLRARTWLLASLFQDTAPASTTSDKIGQFFPGAAGGANATAGYEGKPTVNPWDFVLMIEGALLLAAASVKRLEQAESGSLVYPFCVNQVGNGYPSAARADEEKAACEIWLPLWDRPATFPELQVVFNEGRAQVHGRAARNGVDFAQAAVTYGVDRGISAFHRYAILERNGQSNFATPLERITVRRNARVDLLADIEQWQSRLRYKTEPLSKPKPPASIVCTFNVLERRIFDLCQHNSSSNFQAVIAALGATERAAARSLKWATAEDKAGRQNIYPLHGLRPQWLMKTEDSLEFRLAATLAGTSAWFGSGKERLWLRQHLEPLKRSEHSEYFRAQWTDKNPENDVTWHEGELTDALNSILVRRLTRVAQAGVPGWPDWSPRPAALVDITAFIERRTNDELLADLIWGLSLVDWERVAREERADTEACDSTEALSDNVRHNETAGDFEAAFIPSSFYALLRLCFRRTNKGQEQGVIPLDPRILYRAISGDGDVASMLATRRLRASGRTPFVTSLPVHGEIARRTAAAMLFPISPRDFRLLEHMTLKQTNRQTT